MTKLSALDLAMFVLETEDRPFGIGPLVLLRPPAGGAKGFADRLTKRMLEHEPGAPFHLRLALSLTKLPSLEPMKDADLSAHVHRMTLDGDGSMSNLTTTVCALHESPLDRSGLLWQFYVIDGLADGRIALYGKVHHGIIDGRSFIAALTHWFSRDPKDREVRALWQGVPRISPSPDKAGLRDKQRAVGGSLRAALRAASGTLRSAASLTRMLGALGLRNIGLNNSAMALPFVGVPRVLSGKVSGKRNYAFTTLPLGEVKALGKTANASVNDMLLAVLDGALELYLGSGSESRRKPLVVDMPVALTGAGGGNQIAILQLAMGKAGATLRERLGAIVEESSRVKATGKNTPGETLMLYTALVHAVPTLLERLGVARPLLISNLLFSNPFGFAGRHFLMGAEVELVLPISAVAAGQMLNVTVVTLGDQLQIGFLGIPGAIDDIERLAECTREAFDELKAEFGNVAPAQLADHGAKRRATNQGATTQAPGMKKQAAAKAPIARRRTVAKAASAKPSAARKKPTAARAARVS